MSRPQSAAKGGKDEANAALRSRWVRSFKEIIEHDSWGQMVEAREGYAKFKHMLEQAPNKLALSSLDVMTIGKLVICMDARLNSINEVVGKPGLKVDQMRLLMPVLDNLFEPHTRDPTFPIDLSLFQDELSKREDLKALAVGRPIYQGGSLLPPPDVPIGLRGVIFHLDKIGLKDATKLIDPSVMIYFVGKLSSQTKCAQRSLLDNVDVFPGIEFQRTIQVFLYQNMFSCTAACDWRQYCPSIVLL
eukprot:TRINITY_DN4915_c0_g1_i3.p1 TRINITY_DN4915_c0_g1~~TRINITY_DN4915_c0_g1_i3.p1  ORF type:complete len:246 (+),score=52.25 TRINITY_DN4915_c0_g1_i3:66-803(+)